MRQKSHRCTPSTCNVFKDWLWKVSLQTYRRLLTTNEYNHRHHTNDLKKKDRHSHQQTKQDKLTWTTGQNRPINGWWPFESGSHLTAKLTIQFNKPKLWCSFYEKLFTWLWLILLTPVSSFDKTPFRTSRLTTEWYNEKKLAKDTSIELKIYSRHEFCLTNNNSINSLISNRIIGTFGEQ